MQVNAGVTHFIVRQSLLRKTTTNEYEIRLSKCNIRIKDSLLESADLSQTDFRARQRPNPNTIAMSLGHCGDGLLACYSVAECSIFKRVFDSASC